MLGLFLFLILSFKNLGGQGEPLESLRDLECESLPQLSGVTLAEMTSGGEMEPEENTSSR